MSQKAEILLVGSGGVGTIAALNLEKGGRARVTAVLRSNYDKVLSDGFHIISCDHGEIQNWRPSQGRCIHAVTNASADGSTVINKIPSKEEKKYDYIVVATKNIPDHHPTCAELISPAVTPGQTTIVLIQNGLNIEKPFLQTFPQNTCLSGVNLIGSHETSPAVIEHEDPDKLVIGAFSNPNVPQEKQDQIAQEFVSIYSASGKTDCTFEPDVPFYRWQKLVYNACLNPICAITGLDTGTIRLADDAVAALVRPAMNEIVAAAKACGVNLPDGVADRMITIDPLTLYLKPSMAEDVLKVSMPSSHECPLWV